MTAGTTVGDVVAHLSPQEVACLAESLGEDAFAAIQGLPLGFATETSPVGCLTDENLLEIQLATLSFASGGLSRETQECIRAVMVANPRLMADVVPETEEEEFALFAAGLDLHLCMTDGEAARSLGQVGLPPPSTMRCLEEETGGLAEIFYSFLFPSDGSDGVENLMAQLGVVALSCGFDPSEAFGP